MHAMAIQLVRLYTGVELLRWWQSRTRAFGGSPAFGPPVPKGWKWPEREEAVLVAEAKADLRPTTNSAFGATYQVFPSPLWRRYLRHLEAERDGRPVPLVLFMLFWGPFWEGLPVGIGSIMGLNYIGSETPVAIMTGLLIGVLLTWYRACRKMHLKVYADLYITRNPDAYTPWQSEQKMTAMAVRLAFKDRMNTVFYGSYATGYIRLETNDDISEFTTFAQVIEARVGMQQLEEAPLNDSYSRMTVTEANGLGIHQTRKKGFGEQLAQNFGFIACVVFVLIGAYCLLQMQDGELLGRPDVKERQATIERMEQERAARDEALRQAVAD